MDPKFTHYLITRFNVNIQGFGPEYIRADARSAKWEMERLPLFEQFCAPSVMGQSSQNFLWRIYCDPDTPSFVTNRIKNTFGSSTGVTLVFVHNYEEMISDIQQKCSQGETPFVITSRLDNDDGIGIDYIKDIQASFLPEGNTIINLLGGVNYQADNGILTRHKHSINNSFISLIEERKNEADLVTVMGFRHLSPFENMTVRNSKSPYSFWMTLHHQNTAIRNNMGWPVFTKSLLEHYAIDESKIHISLLNTLRYSMKWFPLAVIKKLKYLYRTKIKLLFILLASVYYGTGF